MINSLTSYRFLIAFVVFLFHEMVLFNWHSGYKVFDDFILNGATFMTGFFVLSGFIMTYVYDNTDFKNNLNIYNFYIKRAAKIYPTYILATIVFFILYHNHSTNQWARIGLNDLTMTQALYPSMFFLGINGGTWSLSVEMCLYFLFPFLMIIFPRNIKILIFGITITALISYNLYFSYRLTDTFKGDSIYSNPIFRLGDFCIGMGFYRIKEYSIFKIKYGFVIPLLILFIVCIPGGHFRSQYMLGQFVIAPLFGILTTCIYYSNSIIWNNQIMIYLGKISYSFYLWQFVWSSFIDANNMPINLMLCVTFIISIIIASISYYLIEEQFRKIILTRFLIRDSAQISST
jgi:peptidoglycan/LPS O-acetylase OafA/YrhL